MYPRALGATLDVYDDGSGRTVGTDGTVFQDGVAVGPDIDLVPHVVNTTIYPIETMTLPIGPVGPGQIPQQLPDIIATAPRVAQASLSPLVWGLLALAAVGALKGRKRGSGAPRSWL